MKPPFVSRGKYEMAYTLHIAVRDQMQQRIDMALHNLAEMRKMYDALRAEYHELASRQPAVTPKSEPVEVEPDVPPSVVLDAMRQISPTDDNAFRANWAYWEKNKHTAKEHPDAFAAEILKGEAPE